MHVLVVYHTEKKERDCVFISVLKSQPPSNSKAPQVWNICMQISFASRKLK